MATDRQVLRRLTLADVDAAVAIQARAFFNDPLWVFLIPDASKRWTPLQRCFRAFFRFGILNGQAYGTGDPLQGVAAWGAPQDRVKFSAVLRSGLPRLVLSSFALQFVRAGKIFGQFEAMQKQYAPEPHYYLQTISVLPEAQGGGMASRLIRPFLQRADEAGVSCYTETMTPANVGLYEHYGFKVMEAYPVPNTDLMLWAFYRAPASRLGAETG